MLIEEKNRLENLKKELKNDIIMGLDLSKNCPGLCIINISEKRVIFKDKFKEGKNKDFYFRMIEIKEWLIELIKIFKVKNIMLEAPFMSPKTAKSNTILLRVHGYIAHSLMQLGCDIYMITPSSARAFLKIKPNKKETAFEYVKNNFQELQLNDFKKDNDIADAVIISLSYFSDKKILLN